MTTLTETLQGVRNGWGFTVLSYLLTREGVSDTYAVGVGGAKAREA